MKPDAYFIKNLPSYAAAVVAYGMELEKAAPSEYEDSCVLLGNDQSVAPKYYRLCIWAGIEEHLIEKFSELYELAIPEHYSQLLQSFNGLSLLGLSLYGIPAGMLRNPPEIDRTSRQCLDLRAANEYWRHDFDLERQLFHFGSRHYTFEKNVGYFFDEHGNTYGFLKDGTEVGSWDRFDRFLQEEVEAAIQYDQRKS